jgi:hypothetical protein
MRSSNSISERPSRAVTDRLSGCAALGCPAALACEHPHHLIQAVAPWIERYRQLWEARFDELDKVVDEMKRKEKPDGRRIK